MTFRQLQLFKRTAELENISKAAEELFIAQPALSKAIKDLETELGYTLFARSGKRISLNKNGEILYKHVLHLQHDLSLMETELREANCKMSSSINVSVRVASKLLPDILSSFYSKFPKANLKIYQINQVAKSSPEYDVVIDSQPPEDHTAFHPIRLLEERIMLALPVNHPLLEQKRIVLADLFGQPCTLLNEFSSLGKLVRSELSSRHFSPDVIFESDNPFMIRDFLNLGISYSFVPEKTWLIRKESPMLVLREIEDFHCSRPIYLSYGENSYISQTVKDFGSHVRSYFKNLT